jgi:TetR/AcrR family transcriptional regulator
MTTYRNSSRHAEKFLLKKLRHERRREEQIAHSKERGLRRAQPRSRFGTRGQPEESRAAIFRAAVAEFAEYGIDGARTDRIAREARVNKALLYYYFKDKDALYEAVLNQVFSGMREQVMPVLDSDLPPKQKLLEYVGRYFDYIAMNPQFPRVVQSEMMRMNIHGSPRMLRIAREYFAPIYAKLAQTLREGAEKREFRAINPMDFVPSMVGIVIFYFSTATMMKSMLKLDPLSKNRIAERRKFVLDFISEAVCL